MPGSLERREAQENLEGQTFMIEEMAREFEQIKEKIHDIRSFL